MKKLMVVAAVIAMGIAAQAAQVTWTASAIAQSSSGSTSYYAYLVDVTGLTDTYKTAQDVAMAIAGDTFTGTVMYEAAGTYNSTAKTVAIAQAKKNLPSEYTNGQSGIKYYSIIFDNADASKASYWMSTGVSGDSAVKTGSISDAGLMLAQHQSQATNSWQAVPEPTSGLLLLIGMAGLALRRRRA